MAQIFPTGNARTFIVGARKEKHLQLTGNNGDTFQVGFNQIEMIPFDPGVITSITFAQNANGQGFTCTVISTGAYTAVNCTVKGF